jgi:hypothetical protein
MFSGPQECIFQIQHIQFQRVPPKEHRVNAAERAICTFKNHFVSTLVNVDSHFPLADWDRLLSQTTLTLNLFLRSSRIHPSLSAYASLFGQFDFNRTPLAPPGTKIVAHISANTRTSFGQHGQVGWYIGPSLKHYRCWKCYFPDTMSERDVLTAEFFPQKIPFPKFTKEAYLQQTAKDMLSLSQPEPTTSPLLNLLSFGPPILNAYAKIADILRRAIRPIPTAPLPVADSSPALQSPTLPTTSNRLIVDSPVLPQLVSVAPVAPSPYIFPQRVQIRPSQPPPHASLPRVQVSNKSHLPKTPPIIALLRKSPQAQLSRHHFDHRTHQRHLVQSIQHDPSVAGKMYHPTTGKVETIDSLLRGPDALKWYQSLTNEWGRCTQGVTKSRPVDAHIGGNNTMYFIRPHQVPADRKVTYATFVCTMRPGKAEPWRIRMTVGGNLLDVAFDVRSPAVSLLDMKLHLNSVISDAKNGARYCTADLKDFFLQSTMKIFQYMRIHRRYLPQEIINEYTLTDDYFDAKGFVYVEICKGMYGLKEAAILAYEQLRDHLAIYGYAPVPRRQPHQVSGVTTHVVPRSLLPSTTSASNISPKPTQITFSPLSHPNTPSLSIGAVPATSAFTLTGLTRTVTSTFPCQPMFLRPSSICIIPCPRTPSTHRIAGQFQFTVKKPSWQPLTFPLSWIKSASNVSNKSQALSLLLPQLRSHHHRGP